MRPSRWVLLVWSVVIVGLVVLEMAELTRVFTVPIYRALNDPIVLVVSLVFTTLIAVVGAIFLGISFTTRLLTAQGFTPFEEEMLRMRADLGEVRRTVEQIRANLGPAAAGPTDNVEKPPEAR